MKLILFKFQAKPYMKASQEIRGDCGCGNAICISLQNVVKGIMGKTDADIGKIKCAIEQHGVGCTDKKFKIDNRQFRGVHISRRKISTEMLQQLDECEFTTIEMA